MYTFQDASMKPAPQGSAGHDPSVCVPCQTMSTRPAEPAATHGNTFVCSPPTWLETSIGADHVAPPSLDAARYTVVGPSMFPLASTGDCAQTT